MTEEVKKTDSSFVTRIKSAVVLALVVGAVLYVGGGAFIAMMAAAAAVAGHEWAQMVLTGKENVPPYLQKTMAVFAGMGALGMGMVENPVVALYFLLALCFLLFAYNFSQKGPPVRLMLFGLIYIGFSIGIMMWLRSGTAVQGLYDVATLLCIVWGSDTFAYLVGRTIGGRKLAPTISPKKTWSGFIGAGVGAGIIAAALACPWLTYTLDVDTVANLTWKGYAVMGVIFGLCGQMGDLSISAFKRHFGVKDTGDLIPGHGGILDRIDALLFVTYLFGSFAMVVS